ncbi:hypothetical protein ACFW15_26985, partial [Streptomyces sp. NPDC058953]
MLDLMDLERVFVGIDAVRWAAVEHAFGGAEDIPGLLRALAGDDDESSEALDELWGVLLLQGTVYEAGIAAVPFLARVHPPGAGRPGHHAPLRDKKKRTHDSREGLAGAEPAR